MQRFCETQIEIRKINEHRSRGTAQPCLIYHLAKAATNAGQMRQDFNKSDDRDVFGIYQKFASGSLHLFAAHAEEVCRRKELLERTYELSAIGIARGLS